MITGSIFRRLSRMLIALLAIAIGATVLSGLVTIYYDVPRQMGKELRSYGANMLLVSSGTESFTMKDFEEAKKKIPEENITGLSPFRYQNVKINHQPFMAAGTDFDQVKKTSPYWYITGSFPEKEGEVLLGQSVASTIGASEGNEITMAIGDSSEMSSNSFDADKNKVEKKFKVSGVLQTGGSEEEVIYMSMENLNSITENDDRLDVVECSISGNSDQLKKYAEAISNAVPSVKPEIVKRLADSENTVLGKLQSLVWIVTLVVLILTMVCVATTMMAVVAERKKEIGLKKALGASNKEIVSEFLGEGLFLGLLGGLFGVVLGYFFAQAVSINVFARSISFQPLIAPITIIVSFLVTGLACLLPVRSTIDIDPALVLKGE